MPPRAPVRHLRHFHRLGISTYVRDRDRGRTEVLGKQPKWPAGHHEFSGQPEPLGCAGYERGLSASERMEGGTEGRREEGRKGGREQGLRSIQTK